MIAITGPARALAADRRGAVAAMLALTLPVLAGVGAVAIDVTHARAVRAQLQSAADLAAIAAAARLPDGAAARSAAVDFVARNLDPDVHGTATEAADVELGRWDPASDSFIVDSGQPSAVRVLARRSSAHGNAVPTWFAGFVGFDGIEVSVEAIAGRGAPPACLIALHPSAGGAVLLDSNARLDLAGCELHAHSTSSRGLWLKSNSSAAADEHCLKGSSWRDESTGTVTPTPQTGCTPATDPAPPIDATVGACKGGIPNPITDTRTLTPGTYCGLTIDSNANVTLAPGTYVIKNAPLRVLSNARLTGNGVTVYLANNSACLFFDSNTVISLTGPSAGDNAGLLIYQPQSVSCSSGLEFNSNTVTKLQGMIYAPASRHEWNSNAVLTSPCLSMVGRTFEFNSNARITIDIDAASCVAMPPGLGGSSAIALLR